MRCTGMSPVVEAWSTCRTSNAQDWPPDQLLQTKGQATVSVVIPARDEEATVGAIVTAVRNALMQAVPLVDEVIVVDSRSADGTAATARAAGALVVSQDDITRGLPPMHGKGDAMWAGLAVASGDVVAFIDADVDPFDPRFVTGLLGLSVPTTSSMSRDQAIFIDRATDVSLSLYAVPLKIDRPGQRSHWGRAVERAVRPVLIVVDLVLAQDLPQMVLVPDEGAVQELASASADPAFGDRVHARGPGVAQRGPDPGTGEDRVERSRIVRAAIADHEPGPMGLIAGRSIARMSCSAFRRLTTARAALTSGSSHCVGLTPSAGAWECSRMNAVRTSITVV